MKKQIRIKKAESTEALIKELDHANNRVANIHAELVDRGDVKHEFHSPVMNSIYTEITPQSASHILKNFNGGKGVEATNRNLSKSNAMKIANDIKDGNFHGYISTIVFDDEGILMDGQTRLQAVLTSKQPCEMHVLMGVPRDGMVKIDIGRRRTNADRFRLSGVFGHVSNSQASKIEMISRMSVAAGKPDGTRSGRPFARVKHMISDQEIIEESERLSVPIEYMTVANPSPKKELRWFPLLVGIAQWWVERDSTGVPQEEEAKQFYDQIVSGLDLRNGDPIHVLREKLIETNWEKLGHNLPEKYALAYGWTIYSINKHTNAEPIKRMTKQTKSYELELL